MINVNSITGIDDTTKEGKMLMAALAVLTSISHKQLDDHEYGGNTHPDDATERICDLTNRIYFPEEYKRYIEITTNRDNTITHIINDSE